MRSRLAAAFTVLVISHLTGAGVAGAAPQGPWILPAMDLSQPDQDAVEPEIAIAPDGTATAVWRRSNGINNIIQASTRPPGGTFGEPENLSATGRDANFPRIAAGPDGTTTVVWERSNGTYDMVQARTRPPGGKFGPIEDLSADVHDSFQPRVAIGPDGTAAVVWFCYCSPGPTNIVKISLRPPGGQFGVPQGLSGGGGAGVHPEVAVGPGGMVVATWTKTLGADKRIQASVRPADGSFGTPQTLSGSGDDSDFPKVAVGPDGSAIVGWGDPDGLRTIEASTRPPGGLFGPIEPLSAPAAATYGPEIATGIDGTTTAVWLIYDGSNPVAQARTRPPGGAFATPETLSEPGRNAGALEIAAGPDGIATAIWSRNAAGGFYIAQSATRPSALSPFGPPLSLSDSGRSANFPEVGVGPDGSAVGLWSRSNGANTIIQQASTQPPEFTLDVAKEGTGSGAVASAPSGIDCGSDCTEDYTSYTKVTLTATPDSGSSFTGWSEACEGATGTTCELEITEAATAGAVFTADPPTPPTPPPPDVCPAKKLKPGKPKRNRKKGTAKLKVAAGGKGKVILKGSKKVKQSSKKVNSSGKGKLTVKARGKAARTLRKKGKVKLKVKLVYRPGGDCPNKTVSRKVKLVRK